MNNSYNLEVWEKLVTHPRLGEILLQRKKINISQLEMGISQHEESMKPLGQIFVDNKIITENDLIELLEIQNEIDNILAESIKEIKSSALNE